MKKNLEKTFLNVAFTHFVPCFFLGIISLFILQSASPHDLFQDLLDNHFGLSDVTLASFNGLFVSLCTVAYHLHHNRRVRSKVAWADEAASKTNIQHAAIVGFAAGSFDIIFGLHSTGIIFLTLLVIAILIWHLKIFTHNIVDMLKPGSIITWSEVAELLRIYLNMLAGFTLINATLEVSHLLIGAPSPFGFGATQGQLFLDSLYFTVVSMTTLGYGDIVPMTWDAKLLLIFQCLVSYVMFALMVGIITRGVVKTRPASTDSSNYGD